ncbi:MAG: NADPH-dependent FMN reductase [Candidatus Diapherotrites archaeon]
MKLLGIAGSLRKESLNLKLLKNAASLAKGQGAEVEIFDLSPIPLYNGDVEAKGIPDSVKELREKIASANGLLLSSPEYNHSIPGVLKNAIDWASRPPNTPFWGKPCAIFGASPGEFGTVRGQLALRTTLTALNVSLIAQPQFHLPFADGAFDENGKMKEKERSEQLGKLIEKLIETIRKIKS